MLITDVSASDQAALLLRKLHQCCSLFDFDDSLSEVKSKEVKRACLSELVEYFGKSGVAASDAVYIEVITMVSIVGFLYDRMSSGELPLCRRMANVTNSKRRVVAVMTTSLGRKQSIGRAEQYIRQQLMPLRFNAESLQQL